MKVIKIEIKKLLKKKKPKPANKDTGLGCPHRLITKETQMYCRLHDFQSKTYCETCKDKPKVKKQ